MSKRSHHGATSRFLFFQRLRVGLRGDADAAQGGEPVTATQAQRLRHDQRQRRPHRRPHTEDETGGRGA